MHDDRDTPDGLVDDGLVDDGEPIEIEFVDTDDAAGPVETVTAVEPLTGGEQAALETEVERLSSELEHLREMYLRKLAEFDNFRKRTDREREEFQKTAVERLIKELLPVVDNFERAQQHDVDDDPGAFREGIAMISKQLWELLQREGLDVVDPLGAPFDPELHEAVQRVEDPGYEPGRVVAVMAKGYTLAGRLLRPAMVSVAVEVAKNAAPAADGTREGKGGASP